MQLKSCSEYHVHGCESYTLFFTNFKFISVSLRTPFCFLYMNTVNCLIYTFCSISCCLRTPLSKIVKLNRRSVKKIQKKSCSSSEKRRCENSGLVCTSRALDGPSCIGPPPGGPNTLQFCCLIYVTYNVVLKLSHIRQMFDVIIGVCFFKV